MRTSGSTRITIELGRAWEEIADDLETMVMRTFIALELSQENKEALGRVIEEVRPKLGKLSWVKPENLHLTLKFLGEVAEKRLEGIKDALSRIAGEHSSFSYRIVGLGCFPNAKRPRVLWAGMKGEIEKAAALTPQSTRDSNAWASRGRTGGFRPTSLSPELRVISGLSSCRRRSSAMAPN